mmetsp:Transcript_18910/g.52078  ORF Transcript_18910/g.52078 Transcript_18910/m.52078 type:complete len:327 (+) Transcript_18910:917-1897(+)
MVAHEGGYAQRLFGRLQRLQRARPLEDQGHVQCGAAQATVLRSQLLDGPPKLRREQEHLCEVQRLRRPGGRGGARAARGAWMPRRPAAQEAVVQIWGGARGAADCHARGRRGVVVRRRQRECVLPQGLQLQQELAPPLAFAGAHKEGVQAEPEPVLHGGLRQPAEGKAPAQEQGDEDAAEAIALLCEVRAQEVGLVHVGRGLELGRGGATGLQGSRPQQPGHLDAHGPQDRAAVRAGRRTLRELQEQLREARTGRNVRRVPDVRGGAGEGGCLEPDAAKGAHQCPGVRHAAEPRVDRAMHDRTERFCEAAVEVRDRAAGDRLQGRP